MTYDPMATLAPRDFVVPATFISSPIRNNNSFF